jgi:ribosomal protein S12 methylthiotransferase
MSNKKHINIVTLGCSKNLVDSEKIMGQLDGSKFKVSHESDGPSDIVIINTCGFIKDAKVESIDTILQYVEAKKNGLVNEVIVTGCLSQRYKEELMKEIPEADAWFGVKEPSDLFAHLKQKYDPEKQSRFVTTPSHFAYLKIAEGCDRTCSFCAIPMIRGAFKSRLITSLVDEANHLADKGVKELLLIAQDLSYYGYDIEKRSMLADLLKELVKIERIEWIRLHYAYPKNFPDQVIRIMAENPKICRYLDIPLQHISDPVLKSMRRNTDKRYTLELIRRIRERIPDVALRTTLLVGYPGETKEQFKELLDFVRETRFERLGVFAYSPEEGTSAYVKKDSLNEREKNKRVDEIMTLQQEISYDLNQEKTGKTFRVIVDREEEEYFVGRTEYDSPEVDNEVYIQKTIHLNTGEFYNVLIKSASEFDLVGEVVSDCK